jgi:Meckel syndrome type 1 protein
MTTQLPPQGPPGPDDKLPGEAELAALYRKLPQREPAAALDDAVRRMAAAAVSSGRMRRRARWPVALGTAATLVLAVGLGWRMREMPSSMPASPPTASIADHAATAGEAATPLPSPPAMHAPRQIAPAATGYASDARQPRATAIAPARMAMKARSTSSANVQPAAPAAKPAPASGAGKLAALPPPVEEASAERHAAATAADTIGPAEPAKPAVAAPANLPASMPAAAPAANGTAAADAEANPAQELDAIGRLFAQGHADEARRRLRAFHRAHPHWVLPDALRDELREP